MIHDPLSQIELGKQLLSGSAGTFAPQKGAELILAAAEHGQAEACALAAVLAGAGICQLQNWDRAFDQVQRAAELGWKPARLQLGLLAAGPATVSKPAISGDWAAMRRDIDLDAWLLPPPKQSLSDSPRIRCIEGFLSPAVCAWLIERARERLVRARIYDADTGEGVLQKARTNSEADFNIVESDLVILLVRVRIAQATGLPPAVMELTKVLRYEVGECFAPHFDFIDPAAPAMADELEQRGQRLATFLVYLNATYTGGETDFPRLGLRHRGRSGDALLFANVDTDGEPDPRTLHAGLPPTAGTKWLLSQWIRDRTPKNR